MRLPTRSPALALSFALTLSFCTQEAADLGEQRVDRYSIPAKAEYQPDQLEGKRPLTHAERTSFAETSSSQDVITFIDSLVALGAEIETGSIGKTTEGRDLPYVIASRPLITTPEEARSQGRPIAYIQANIHSGEVEGKEAMQAMLRDLLFDPGPNILDSLVLIVQPNYNADGNDHLSPNSRRSQNGPVMTGTRQQTDGINLNRDYVGADAPETKASLAMLNRWDPDLFMDLHTTDGSIHGYALTYAPTLLPTAVTTAPYMYDTMMPEIRRRVLERQGFYVYDYGDFSSGRRGGGGFGGGGGAPAGGAPGAGAGGGAGAGAAGAQGPAGRGGGQAGPGRRRGPGLEEIIADSIPESGWVFSTYTHLPRYGTNWYGLRGRISILSEAFSHDPFPRRVASTYAFVRETLSYVAEHKDEIFALEQEADAKVASWAENPGSSPPLALRSRMDTTRIDDVRVEVVTELTDTTQREAGLGDRHRTGIVKLVSMPVMASFTGTLDRTLPYGYSFSAAVGDSIVGVLKTHGLEVQRLTAPASVEAQGFRVDSISERGRNETPRDLKELEGTWSDPGARTLPAGSYVVRAGQPYGLLAFYLLEPETDDGIVTYLGGFLSRGSDYPVIRITAPAELQAQPVP